MSKKLISLVLTAMAMAALVGCGNKKPTETSSEEPEVVMPDEYNLLNHWKGNMEEDYYTVTEGEAATTIAYADVNGEDAAAFNWVYVARSFSYDASVAAKFTEYKKISFTGKLEKTSGTNLVMVKVEGSGQSFEKRFEFKATESTYEFSTNFVTDWTGITQMLFFVNRSTNEVGNGTMTFTKMVLSKQEVDPLYDIAPGMPAEPQGYTLYNGGDSVDIMYRWGYNAEGEIATEAVSGGYKFSYKTGAKGEWSYVSGWVKDGDHSLVTEGLKTLHFEVKGPAGQTALFKFEDRISHAAKESGSVTFTGETQVVEFDVSTVITGTATEFMAIIFPCAGANAFAADGEILMTRCYLDKTELVVPMNYMNYADVFLDEHSFASPCYQVANENHVTTLTYTAGGEWDNVQFPIKFKSEIEWANVADYTRVVAELQADVDVQVLLKAYDNGQGEKWVSLKAGVKQYVSYEVPSEICALNKTFIVFVDAGSTAVQHAVVTLTGLRLVRNTANYDVNGYTRINRVNNPNGSVVTVDDNGDMNVAFSATEAGYGKSMELFVSNINLANAKKVSGILVSDVDTCVLLKPGDDNANEHMVELKAGVQTKVEYTLTNPINELWGKFIIFMAAPGSTGLEGNVKFIQFYLSVEEVTLPVGNFSGYATGADDSNIFVTIALANKLAFVEVGSLLKVQTTYGYEAGAKLVSINVAEGVVVTATFDGQKLVNVGVTGDAAAMLKNNNEITLNGAAKYWNLDGTTEELRAQFIRRYRANGASSWTVDNNEEHTDRIVRDEVHFVGGTGAMSIRPYSGSGNAIGLSLKDDFEAATNFKNIGFWIYNSSEKDIPLRTWVFTAKGLTGAAEIGGLTAKAGGWTYCRMGFDKAIYNFNISNWNGSANALVFDNISLF